MAPPAAGGDPLRLASTSGFLELDWKGASRESMALNAMDNLSWLVDDDGHACLAACSAAALGRRRERAEEGEEVDQRRGNNTGSFWAFSWRWDEAQGALEPSRRRGGSAACSQAATELLRRRGGRRQRGLVGWAGVARGLGCFPFSIFSLY